MRASLPMLLAALLLAAAPSANAAKTCSEPGQDGADQWNRATPAEAGMDAAKLQDAIDYGTTQASFAVRVYRGGCLVGEDRLADQNRFSRYESWSMAKSVTALAFGRAMTLGLISPDDPVGSLIPEADGPHGQITAEHLLTMTSGLYWNGLRDYNIFSMPDRIVDALTLEPVKKPGTYFEYAQSPVALLAEMVGRSAGMDVMDFLQKELLNEMGIQEGSWVWQRDKAGHVLGFAGVGMTPDDFGKLGDLMRRGGVWRGQRLLSREFMRRSLEPSKTNGCYGWLIWLNAAQPCIGPTVANRPVKNSRDFPDLPADQYSFSGLFGQRVTVFPSQDLVITRTGQDPGLVPAGQANWEHELYVRVLGSITDQKWDPPGEAPRVNEEREDVDYGFGKSVQEPDQYSHGAVQDPLPPAGPARARAAVITGATKRVGKRGRVKVRIACPPVGELDCNGTATLTGAKARGYKIRRGLSRTVTFKLSKKTLKKLRKRGKLALTATARTGDSTGGTVTKRALGVTG